MNCGWKAVVSANEFDTGDVCLTSLYSQLISGAKNGQNNNRCSGAGEQANNITGARIIRRCTL